MKKTLIAALLIIGVCSLFAPGTASAFLLNWNLDADGAGVTVGQTLILEYLDTIGNTRVLFDGLGGFTEKAVFKSPGHDGAGGYGAGAPELTAVFTGAGTVVLSGPITFTSGTLTIYSDAALDYATTSANTYGASNGTPVGTFSLLSGSGLVDPTGVPNGVLTTLFVSTSLAPGYWFLPDGITDMSTLPSSFVLGFATTNASKMINVPADLLTALGPYPPDGSVLYVSNNGQFRLDVVPEPTTMILFTIGAAGMAALRRKRAVA